MTDEFVAHFYDRHLVLYLFGRINCLAEQISLYYPKSKQFFLLLDKGPTMKGNDTNLMWKIFRRGWAPFFKDIEVCYAVP